MGPGLCRTIGRQLNEFMRLKAAPWRSIFQSEHIGATKLWQSCGKVGFGCLAKADPAAILFAATALERRLRSICLIFHSSPTVLTKAVVDINVKRDAVLCGPLPHKGASVLYSQCGEVKLTQLKLHAAGFNLGKIQDLINKREQMATQR
jgi:hypothetical protein